MKRTARNQNRRPQTPKANREMMAGFQELRKGSRTTPVPSGTLYRKPKYRHMMFEEN